MCECVIRFLGKSPRHSTDEIVLQINELKTAAHQSINETRIRFREDQQKKKEISIKKINKAGNLLI